MKDRARRLKELRAYLGFDSGAAFARDLGISKQTVSAMEVEGRGITTERIQLIVNTFSIDVRYFFPGQGIDSPESADLTKREKIDTSTTEAVVTELRSLSGEVNSLKRNLSPSDDLDQITNRVRINSRLRQVVSLFFLETADALAGIEGAIVQYLSYRRELDSQRVVTSDELVPEVESKKAEAG